MSVRAILATFPSLRDYETTITSSRIPKENEKTKFERRVNHLRQRSLLSEIGDRSKKTVLSARYNLRRAPWLQTVQLFSLNNLEQLAPPPWFSCCPRRPSIRHTSLPSVSTARSISWLLCKLHPRSRVCQRSRNRTHQSPSTRSTASSHSRRHINPIRRHSHSYYPTISR